ncbi:MAG TPA: hypothetical protein VEE84_07585 [Burkholderiaceae bacterium]|nr:hypothetical protein [Burkholderiaceae bacterium]
MKRLFPQFVGLLGLLCPWTIAAAESGVITALHDVQIADIGSIPGATTAGDMTHKFSGSDPNVMETMPRRWMTEVTVTTDDGKRVKVIHDREPGYVVGAHVVLTRKDGDYEVKLTK